MVGVTKTQDESYDSFITRLLTLNNRWLVAGITSVEEIKNEMVLSRFLYCLSPACVTFVTSRRPTSARETARWATEFQAMQGPREHHHQDSRWEIPSFQHRQSPMETGYRQQTGPTTKTQSVVAGNGIGADIGSELFIKLMQITQ